MFASALFIVLLPPPDYATQVQPLFAKHCASCHGDVKQKAGLRLGSGSQALKGSINGPVVVAKNAKASKLVQALKGEGDLERMPPAGPLTDAEIELISRWIDAGATVPPEAPPAKHWAFEPPKQAPVPNGVHPIDHFLKAERKKKGLVAAPQADKATLVRRLTLDLTGLPPTPAEIDSFVNDASPNAYAKRAAALLASPRYGERWGRHFLDVWRYSDWYGYAAELRNSQKHIWNWRDWVVESLNAGKPYDAMVKEMLAGDELKPEDPATLRATGFLARNYYKFNRNVTLDDTVEHTGKAFLGITLNCCRCHDHMYDPLSQEEYFRFRAIFEPQQARLDPVPGEEDAEKRGLPRVFDADPKAVTFLFERGDDKRPVKDKPLQPGVPAAIGPGGYTAMEAKLPAIVAHPILREQARDALLDQARKAVEAAKTEQRKHAALLNLRALQAKLNAEMVRHTKPSPELVRHAVALHLEAALATAEADSLEADEALKKLEAAEKKDAKAITAAKKKATDAKPKLEAARKAFEKPPTDYPAPMASYPEVTTGRRTALANWIASKENPLTARVLVNHLWLRHFGQPLVSTVFDFGRNGRAPSHPALLDWLAVEFMKSNWDLKKLHLLMVTSDAYKMRSTFANDGNKSKDPDNLMLWRMNPRALEAEAIRDGLLSVAGMLDETRGGPDLDVNDEAPKQRRSLYYRHAPEKMMPFLAAFDNPSPTECYRRPTTVVPQQAMALVNSKLSGRAAEALARDLPIEAADAFIDAVYRRLLGRAPDAEEMRLCAAFLKDNPPSACVQALFNQADFSSIR